MSSKDTSIVVPAEFAELVRVAAVRSQRSLAAQLEYWARIGRAVERLPLAREHLDAAAHGTLDADDLTDEELAFFEEALALVSPTPAEEAAFADYLRQHGGGAGDSTEEE